MKHRLELSWFYEYINKSFKFIYILLAVALNGLVGQSAYAVCVANTSAASDCSYLEVSGTNLTVNVYSGVTVDGALPSNIGFNNTITGAGTRSTIFGTVEWSGFAIKNDGVIDSLIISPTGVLRGHDTTIINGGTIRSLVNQNQLWSDTDFGNGAMNNLGPIGIFTNTGTVTGKIFNSYNGDPTPPVFGTIGTINNLQGQSGPLLYDGNLPTRYNIIIYSTTNYGSLRASGIGGSMIFGIYGGGVFGVTASGAASEVAASTVTSYIYRRVLVSDGPESFTGHLTGLTGTYGIYSYSLVLSTGSTDTWDLVVTLTPITPSDSPTTPQAETSAPSGGTTSSIPPPAPTSMSTGSTVSLSSIGVTYTPVFTGGTLILAPGNQSSLNFLVTSAGGTITSPSSGAATLSGVFSGPGGLTFNGSGTTVLSGNNTFAGGTNIASGTLSISGQSATGTGSVLVGAGGQLSGTGTISGALTVAGILKPGNSPGYLSALSTVTMNNGSTYLQDIAGIQQANSATPVGATGYYSYMLVAGSPFVINPGSVLSPRLSNLFSASESGYGSAPYTPSLGDRFRIVTADGGIAGKFSSILQPAEMTAGTQFISFYNMAGSNSIDLSVIPTSYQSSLSSTNANTRSVAGVLDKLVVLNQAGVSTSSQDHLLYLAAGQNASSLASYVQGLAGEVYAATVAVVSQASLRVQEAVLSRLSDLAPMLAGLTNTASPAGVAMMVPGIAPGPGLSSNPGVNPFATPTNMRLNSGAVWGEIAYQRGNRASDDQGSGFSSNLYQMVLGGDAYSEHGRKFGGGLALSNTNVTANQGTGTVQQATLFLYGKLPVDLFVIDGMASFGLNTTSTNRADVTGYSGGFNQKNISGNDALLSLGVSRAFDMDAFRVTPYVRATWQLINQSSFNDGASPAALSVDSFNGNGVRGVIGVALGSKTMNPLDEKFTYRVSVGIGMDSYSLINPTLNASLAGIPTTITTPRAGSTFAQAGLFGTVKFADNAYAFAGVGGEFRNGSTLASVNAGLRILF